MHRLGAIKVPLADGVYLLVAPSSDSEPEHDMQSYSFLPQGWEGKLGTGDSPIIYDPTAKKNGIHPLALVEIASFHWELITDPANQLHDISLRSSLSGSFARKQWRQRRTSGRLHGDFRFTVYLGAAWCELERQGQRHGRRLHFEVITEKIDYLAEYRAMVETIGHRCSQLLLDWGTPTTVHVSSDPERRAQTLLERFLFLRHVLGPDRLDLFLEQLTRRPHSSLARERIWSPAAVAAPAGFARDPLRYGRQWNEEPIASAMVAGHSAAEILAERKFDVIDTPPNRFIKFALQAFRSVCEDVINSRIKNPETGATVDLKSEKGAAWQEAVQMRETLDAALAAPFFNKIGLLKRIPFDSQTLQKREGYREILHAWLMLEVAAQLDWPGRNDAYDGTNRDVATLYEFWLYFVLFDLFRKRLSMQWLRAEESSNESALPFCCQASDGGLRINLKRGSTSLSRFIWKQNNHSLLIHFFYNRGFGEQSVVLRDGSYTKGFRPDYTAVVMPGEYAQHGWRKAEEVAEEAGMIAYLHFDAKYRIDTLKDLFDPKEQTPVDQKESKTTGSVKDADLYKMHTYNEAIRRTVGSYVLYPGSDASYVQSGPDRNVYRRYHELLPGIGAFAVKPSAEKDHAGAKGVQTLQRFIQDFLQHQLSRFTQAHRVNFWTHETLKEDVGGYQSQMPDFSFGAKPPKDTQVLFGWVRDGETALACKEASVFFCHAVEWQKTETDSPGPPTDLQFDPFRCNLFVAYYQNHSFPWIAEVADVRLVTAQERAAELGVKPEKMKAAYYYRFQLRNLHDIAQRDVEKIVRRRPGKPVANTLNEFAKCPVLPQ
jgi:predicted component of viral defense system (DUF524 family)